ncbi:MerR family transcriptional regulator [Pediococcus inopinatus]|uniref:MerR family transcriptional regulator n=1 Tax=Pediococcus inopinatus TaxID=114090 RepID=A0ABZ0Q6V4_9LACO|nr:MerR family transcriptional regulator [Pediococcus inopinatus]WPC20525.1 MerR family transcriptional regulator [Pediococcus inopinatus]WPC22227.1 MerR family transcriptional regulator [Pediococcus inopinatus]WPP08841.1 MerR family transcriptional regulator [Pediococcus inopinatus]
MKIDGVAKKYNLSTATLRYYERNGLLGPIKRVNGIRYFEESDLQRIEFILCVKECGMTLGQIRHFIEMFQKGDQTLTERLTVLENQLAQSKQKMQQLRQSMQHLEGKIDDVKLLIDENVYVK